MGVSHSTARVLAPLSFIVDFAMQNYGMLSKPNMKDIHDRNPSAFSPAPFSIAGFFAPQQVLQLIWLYQLYKLPAPEKATPAQKKELATIVDYVPYYAIGNFSIAAWMLFWNNEKLGYSHALVTLNTFTQLYYVIAKQGPLNTNSTASLLTHVVSKTFAGIGILDFLHNGAVAFYGGIPPSNLVKALTGVGFALGAASSDWIMGGCLVYDLIGLAVGQTGQWQTLLGIYAAATAGIVGVKNFMRPPYVNQPLEGDDYERV